MVCLPDLLAQPAERSGEGTSRARATSTSFRRPWTRRSTSSAIFWRRSSASAWILTITGCISPYSWLALAARRSTAACCSRSAWISSGLQNLADSPCAARVIQEPLNLMQPRLSLGTFGALDNKLGIQLGDFLAFQRSTLTLDQTGLLAELLDGTFGLVHDVTQLG